MPVFKYRRVEDMPPPPKAEPTDAWKRISDIWALSDRLSPRRYPHGVFRFRSIDEANRQRDEWTTERLRSRGGASATQ